MHTTYALKKLEDAPTWASATANHIATALSNALDTHGQALLLVSGGSTPGPIFDQLSQHPLDWSSITIALVDERWVPDTHEWSNTRLVKERLLKNQAATANWLSITSNADSPEAGVAAINAAYEPYKHIPHVVLLGMGADSHTASLFPHMVNDPAMQTDACGLYPVASTGNPECPRITFGFGSLIASSALILAISGQEKLSVLEAAFQEDAISPIGAVIQSAEQTTHVFWRP